MATISNTFQRFVKSVDNATTTGIIGGSGVATNTDLTCMGLIVTNTYNSPTNTPITVDVKFRVNAVEYFLIKDGRIPEGESLIVIGWDQKLVMKPTDDIIIVTKNALETADVVLSVLEIVTTP
jgi:hypothetical protein